MVTKIKSKTYTAKKGDSFTDSAGRTGTVGFSTKTGKALADGESTKIKISSNDKVSKVNKIIQNQSNLVQTTDTEKSKQNQAGAAINNKLQEATGIYGTPVKDQAGNIIGTEKFNTKTGEALVDPNAKPEVTPEGNMKDSLGNTYFSSMPKNMTYKLPNPSVEGNKWVFDQSGKPYEMDATGKVTTNTMAEQEYNTNIQSNQLIDDNNAMYDSLKKNVSIAHQNLIEGIKQKYQLQKTQMEDLNKRYLASKTVAGFRTGSTEYTPEIAMGILKAEQEEGIQRIQEIDDKMNLALAEAVTAKNSDELDIAKEKFDTYKELQKEKEDAIIEHYKTYTDNQKYINDAKKALETESRATEDQAMQKLKAAADAYVKGYNSAPNKTKYVNDIATKWGLDPDVVLGEIINATPKPKSGSGKGGLTTTEINANKKNDIASAILEFKDKIKNGWRGINPDAYEYYREEIKKEYGAAAVLEFDKAIIDNGLKIDENGELVSPGGGKSAGLKYSATELKKLRAEGIDPENIEEADAFLYSGR